VCEINNNKPTPLEIRAILNKFLRFHPVFVHVKYTYNMAACYMNVVNTSCVPDVVYIHLCIITFGAMAMAAMTLCPWPCSCA